MEDKQYITMIVRWDNQRRPINITIDDDLNSIKTVISTTYELQQTKYLCKYQIQYYDTVYGKFMDLCPVSFNLFREHLNTLLSPNAPPKTAKEWLLKIVPKSIETSQPIIHEPIADDTYNYQQENDPTESLQNEEPASIINNIQSSSLRIESRSNNSEHSPREPILRNNNEGQQETAQPDPQPSRSLAQPSRSLAQPSRSLAQPSRSLAQPSRSLAQPSRSLAQPSRSLAQPSQPNVVNPPLVDTYEHRYGLSFGAELYHEQRQQYESDISSKTSSKVKRKTGGSLLQACEKLNATSSNGKCLPRIHFQIAADEHHLSWILHLCVLTQADSNGNHYLHASKGIYNPDRIREDTFGMITNTNSFNPYVVRLTQDNLRDETYEIEKKVCNMTNLPHRNTEQLRDFSRLNNRKSYIDPALLSDKTTRNLNFDSAKYHLGCILYCGEVEYDRCISSLTIAVPGKKPNDNGEPRQREGVTEKKKNKREDGSERKTKKTRANEVQ